MSGGARRISYGARLVPNPFTKEPEPSAFMILSVPKAASPEMSAKTIVSAARTPHGAALPGLALYGYAQAIYE